MNKILLFFFLAVVTKESFASFPILTAETEDVSIANLTFQKPWYISAKNSILFLASSIFGLSLFSVFVNEGFIDSVADADIHEDVMGSDHCPVSIELVDNF